MSDNELEDIRQQLSVEREISHAATDWTDQSGGDRVGRCTHPVHGHTSSGGGTPNLIVTDDGGWYCYSHSTGGGIFEWVAVEEGICSCRDLPLSDGQFKDALSEAADRAGVELSGSSGVDNYEEAEELGTLSDEEKAKYALDEALDILHDNLDTVIDGRTVRQIIKDRRPFGDETIDRARIGYLDDQAHTELLERLSADALQHIGIHRDNNSLHGRGRIVYPYLARGLPTYWVGRKTPESDLDSKYLKPNGDTTVLEQPIYEYSGEGARDDEGVWIVEGIQDAISVAEHGGVRAISAVATNPSSEQLSQLVSRAQDAGRAVVCFDADEGGQGDAIDLALDIMSAGVHTSIAPLPDGTDPNDYFMDGGQFSDLEAVPAAEEIVNQRGDSQPLIERILDTAAAGTPRADRLVKSLSDVTPIRRETLRGMMDEQREYEQQQGWREPSLVKKTAGADSTIIFHYADGTEIEMESLMSRYSVSKFCDKYVKEFGFAPDISRDEWIEMLNDWMREIRVVEVDPLSEEGSIREQVQKKLQDTRAIHDRNDLSKAGAGAVTYQNDMEELIVPSEMVSDWADEFEVSLRKLSDYLDPITAGNTARYTVEGRRVRFWRFDVETITGNGYVLPDPSPTPETEQERKNNDAPEPDQVDGDDL